MHVRIFAMLVLAALVFTALAAVATLIFGEFDETAARILGTSGSVAGYSLLAMAGTSALAATASKDRRMIGWATLLLALAGLALSCVLIWAEGHDEPTFKAWGVTTVTSVALTLVVLLARAPLPSSHRWLRWATSSLILLIAVLIDVPVICFEVDSESLGRTLGVLGVLAALGILTTPVVAWQRRRTPPADLGELEHVRLVCPRCGEERDAPVGRSTCPQCAQGVELELFTT